MADAAAAPGGEGLPARDGSLRESLAGDIAALAAITRDSAGEGEELAATHVADRLRQVGVPDVEVTRFRGRRTYAWSHGAHALIGLILSFRRGAVARLGSLLALVSLELDASGMARWVDRFLPTGTGTNVIARIPPAGGAAARSTLVIVAHHDAARTGLVWHPALARASAGRRLRSRRIDGFMLPVAIGFLLAALPLSAVRRVGSALLGLSLAAVADVGRGSTVPGASDNASGVAGLISLAGELSAQPLEDVEVLLWSVGCEESGMDGMRAALAGFEGPGEVLFLGLDTLGAGKPIVAAEEGTILGHRYGTAELDLLDRAADSAGLQRPARWRIGGWTDPIVARFAGFAAISLLSIGPEGNFTDYHLPTDTPERVDMESVLECLEIARAVVREHARGVRSAAG